MKNFRVLLILLAVVSMFAAACGSTAPEPADSAGEVPEAGVVEEADNADEAEVEEPEEDPAEEPVEAAVITYWHTHSDPEVVALEELIEKFETENPGITIEHTDYAWEDFKPALLTSVAGGEVPDTVRMDIIWVPEFADMGALMHLDGVMPGFDEIAADAFPGPLSTNYWDGHYYGLPISTNTQVLLWHEGIFTEAGLDAPPATVEEFADVACQVSDPDNEVYGYALGGTYFWAPAPLFYTMGGKIVDENVTTASGYVNGPESVAVFTMLKDMYDQGCISPNLMGGGIGTSDGHATGMYAMIIDGPWMKSIYETDFPDFAVNFAPMPVNEAGTNSSVVGGEDLVLFEGSDNPEAAMAWAAFLLSEEAQLRMAEAGTMPVRSSLIGSDRLPEHFDVFLEQLKTAQARVPHPEWTGMDDAVNNAFQRILRGDQTVQEALDQAAEEINALLQ